MPLTGDPSGYQMEDLARRAARPPPRQTRSTRRPARCRRPPV